MYQHSIMMAIYCWAWTTTLLIISVSNLATLSKFAASDIQSSSCQVLSVLGIYLLASKFPTGSAFLVWALSVCRLLVDSVVLFLCLWLFLLFPPISLSGVDLWCACGSIGGEWTDWGRSAFRVSRACPVELVLLQPCQQ